jgi:hypothetical protein
MRPADGEEDCGLENKEQQGPNCKSVQIWIWRDFSPGVELAQRMTRGARGHTGR